MKAIILKDFGGPDVLHLEERPRPSPGFGEALVKVAAVVARVLPFSAVTQAHALLDARAVTGRIVLQGW